MDYTERQEKKEEIRKLIDRKEELVKQSWKHIRNIEKAIRTKKKKLKEEEQKIRHYRHILKKVI